MRRLSVGGGKDIANSPQLMKRFDMSIINPDKPMKSKASIFVCDTDFWVILRKRAAHQATKSQRAAS